MHHPRASKTVLALFVLLVVLLVQDGYAQFDTLWTRTYSMSSNARLNSVAALNTGDYAAAGFEIAGQNNALLMVVNPLGDTLWTRSIGSAMSGDKAFDVAQLSNNTIVVCGQSQGQLSAFAAGYTPNGNQVFYEDYDAVGVCGANAILPRPDGGFWLLGFRTGLDNSSDFWLISCDANGDSLTSYMYATTGGGEEYPNDLFALDDGGLELIGSTRVPPAGNNNYDFLRVRVDASGNELDTDTYGTERWEMVYGCARDPQSGEIIIAGEDKITSANKDGLALKLSSSGSALWDHSFTNSMVTERLTGAATYLEGGALFCGYAGGSSESTHRLWLIAVNSGGDTAWTWLGAQQGQAFDDLLRTLDGGFVACGRANIGGNDRPLIWRVGPPSGVSGMIRDRNTGEPIAGVTVRTSSLPQYSLSDSLGRFTLSLPEGVYDVYSGGPCFTGDTIYDIQVLPNENTLADVTVGAAHASVTHTTINVLSPNGGQGVADLVVANAGSGDLVFSFTTESLSPSGNWLSVQPPSGRIVPGDTLVAQVLVNADTTNDGNYDYFGRVELHANSCPETLRVFDVLAVILDAESGPALPSEFALYPAFPNPFNSSTRLRFGIDRDSDASLRIYDVTGRIVATLLDNQRITAGEHTLDFSPRGLASGLYFVRLENQSRSQTQRLLYIR